MSLASKIQRIAVAGLIGILGSCTKEEIKPRETENKQRLTTVTAVRDGKEEKVTIYQSYLDALTSAGIPIEAALKYDLRFHRNFDDYSREAAIIELKDLYKRGIDPEVINKYSRGFGVEEIINLYEKDIMPEIANEYNLYYLRVADIILLVEKGINPKVAKMYYGRFPNIGKAVTAMIELHSRGISPVYAHEFDKTLDHDDVLVIDGAGITVQQANAYAQVNKKYGANLTGSEIVYLMQQNISPEVVEKRAKELLLDRIIRSK